MVWPADTAAVTVKATDTDTNKLANNSIKITLDTKSAVWSYFSCKFAGNFHLFFCCRW